MEAMQDEWVGLLEQVWREACRHIDIAESTTLVAPLLAEVLPVELVLVRRFDLQRSCLETVAAGQPGELQAPEHARTELRADELDRLLDWGRQGRILRGDGDAKLLALIAPAGLNTVVAAGPLRGEGNTDAAGVLVLAARNGEDFAPDHYRLLQALLEPFSAALENDRRVREMATLREAAEADKRTLLTKLGREEISDTIVGIEQGLRGVMERVELVARSDVPVLILGETGSGKEVVARAIHSRSRRASGPFLRVNCGAIPPELIDSELFGHEKGSFTGAIAMRKGWFERADGGTLFLDEVGELPAAAQVRLLRILQDGAFERVGGQRSLQADVRIIAATHRDLKQMVSHKHFREDLWYRIAVFPIELPPLRNRPEDIPALAAHFALRACRRFGFPPQVPTSDDLNLLVRYSWPGNVRELAAVLDRAAILGDGRSLQVAKALGAPAPENGPHAIQAANELPVESAEFPTLNQAMARHIEAALIRTRGQIEGTSGAAALLGINPHTLRARMRKLGVAWQRFRG